MCVPSNDFLGFFYFPSCEKKIIIKASRYDCTSLVHNNHVSSRVVFYDAVVEYPFVCDTFTIQFCTKYIINVLYFLPSHTRGYHFR